jgi:Ca2+-binding EF-hand superfamily protein
VFEGDVWSTVSANAKDFILKLLQRKSDDRPAAKEALMHKFKQNRNMLSQEPTPELIQNIGCSVIRYAECSRFKKIALHVIANRSSSKEIFDLRNAFDTYDPSFTGSLSTSDFKSCLAPFNTYSDREIHSIVSKVVRWESDKLSELFLSMVVMRCQFPHTPPNFVLLHFDNQEVNNTGRILYTEFLASTLEVQGNLAQSRITDAFSHFDGTSKGYVLTKMICVRYWLGP